MQFTPHFAFDGRCEEAFRFYQACLGGDLPILMRYRDTPYAEQAPPDWQDKIIHGRLMVGEATLTGSDAPPSRHVAPGGTMTMLRLDTPEEADRVFAALSDGATIDMPIAETFFAYRFGMLHDRFGIPWMVICERPPSEMCAAQ